MKNIIKYDTRVSKLHVICLVGACKQIHHIKASTSVSLQARHVLPPYLPPVMLDQILLQHHNSVEMILPGSLRNKFLLFLSIHI